MRPTMARIWDRNSWSGPWCVARLRVVPDVSLNRGWERTKLTQARGMDFDQCCIQAKVEIDGQAYCERHAGEIALAVLLGEPTGGE
jgi:hypothetical protein